MSARKPSFSHLRGDGNPRMVDVSGKTPSVRTARARAVVHLPPAVHRRLGGDEPQSPKGPVFQTAVVAGIQAAKKTPDLIPLCHSIPLEDCSIDIAMNDEMDAVIVCTCKTTHKTGVEMEALTGAAAAALTIYDMCKGLSHDIEIREIHLLEKTGGAEAYRRRREQDTGGA